LFQNLQTPAYLAACHGHQELLSLLLDAGADVSIACNTDVCA
jgi:ankyrin repeat protein